MLQFAGTAFVIFSPRTAKVKGIDDIHNKVPRRDGVTNIHVATINQSLAFEKTENPS